MLPVACFSFKSIDQINHNQHHCIRFRFESGAIYRWEFERHGIAETINVAGPLTLTDQALMVEAAIDGIGIAFVPDFLVAGALREGHLQRVLEEWCPAFPGVCLYYPGRRYVPSGLRALIGTIQNERRPANPETGLHDSHPVERK
ncbi:LysR substrate-binding domain-containing protein [Brucella pituitosa]|uniref:LysR substrate-binding domain-containing protein n=1 Tax=Brucella pituitosa TaxID=571256 RepID=UPI002003C972|nr:LysR substrate-binding domain-containing protein [Brucella pituitosa]